MYSSLVLVLRTFRLGGILCILAMLVSGCALLETQQTAQQATPPTTASTAQEAASAPSQAGQSPAPLSPQKVSLALALPLTGPYGGIGEQILNGAQGAQQYLQDQGAEVQIHVIDTNQPDYLERIRALPNSVAVVGGPLRPDIFESIVLEDLNGRHAFFTFLQSLPNSVTEGRNAWRFFSSPTDQMRTVIKFASNNFGIRKMGILFPNEPFGQRVARLFAGEAENAGVSIASTDSYPPDDPLRWSDIVAEFLYDGQENEQDSFQAVFLPDAWSKVEMLVPYFYYHQKEHMLILGSTLWGQTLSSERHVDAHNFRLAVFPSPWWTGSGTVAAAQLNRYVQGEKSFWNALGFDFVRFVASLGSLPAEADGNFINQQIRNITDFSWSMAPILWDYTGVAQQEMFLLMPTAEGVRPANANLIRERLAK